MDSTKNADHICLQLLIYLGLLCVIPIRNNNRGPTFWVCVNHTLAEHINATDLLLIALYKA